MIKNSLKKWIKNCVLGIIIGVNIAMPLALADAPSLLPGDNANIGAYGDACIGLADKIRQGEITLREIPCFLKYFSKTLIAIGASLAVIFVMIGGYKYTMFDKPDDKSAAKNTIIYALVGLVVSMLAWVIVDIVLQLATG